MSMISKFNLGTIESIAKILADTTDGFTGSEIGSLLSECRIPDLNPKITKWRRLNTALAAKQESDDCSNNIIAFIQQSMNPVRHINKHEWFVETRYKLNKVISFEGFNLKENGKICRSLKVNTINEATARASRLRECLVARKVHSDILEFCKEELLADNYFHSVFESTKSVAEKIRKMTGLNSDGACLVDEAFSFKQNIPYLALNSLQTESEQNEQKGFMNLLKGIFGMFRNTTAHAPKIIWNIDENDALDILSLISLVHRRLDNSTQARRIYNNEP